MPDVLELLEQSRSLGFLGEQPLERQVSHATGFAVLVAEVGCDGPRRLLDLGSGGGLPGLVLVELARHGDLAGFPVESITLLDGSRRRADWLEEALTEMGVADDVAVIAERAEVAARSDSYREAFDVVVARSFGPPAVAAECAAGFLRPSGRLVVSEPPPVQSAAQDRMERPVLTERWPRAGLAELGLGAAEPRTAMGFHFVVMSMESACPHRYPRRTGIPAKRPLF